MQQGPGAAAHAPLPSFNSFQPRQQAVWRVRWDGQDCPRALLPERSEQETGRRSTQAEGWTARSRVLDAKPTQRPP